MKNIDPEKSNSNQPPQIYICLVVSLSPQCLLICSKKKKIKWPTTHTCSSSTISLQTPNPAMADHSHLFFFNNLSPNPAMADHSQLISAAPTPS